MTLGAQIKDVFTLVLGRAARILVPGLAIGMMGTAALARSLSALFFGVRANSGRDAACCVWTRMHELTAERGSAPPA